jgi:aryl-alcohol dehydrogenase-like predicted oxidoreductase
MTLAEAQRRGRFSAIQVEYNLVERTAERELLPMSEHLGLSTLAWGPLAGGLLSGKYLPGHDRDTSRRRLRHNDRRLTDHNLAIATEVAGIADKLGTTPAVIALAWLRAQPTRPIPILGARTPAQLEELLRCLNIQLPEAALQRLNVTTATPLGYPHDFLSRTRTAYATTSSRSAH